jgi:hypothetical protein
MNSLYARLSVRTEIENKDAIRRQLNADVEAFKKAGGKIVEVSNFREPHPTQDELNQLRKRFKNVRIDYNPSSFEWHVYNGGNKFHVFQSKSMMLGTLGKDNEHFKR